MTQNSLHPTNQSFSRKMLAVLGFILFLNIFLLHSNGPVRFALEIGGFFLFLIVIFANKETFKRQTPLIIGSGIALALCMRILTSRSYWLMDSLFTNLSYFIIFSLIYLLSTQLPFFRSLAEVILMPVRLLGSYLTSALNSLAELFKPRKYVSDDAVSKAAKYTDVIKRVVFGLLISIPVLFILVAMLSSADAIYADYVKNFFSFKLSKDLAPRLVYSFFAFIWLMPFLYFTQKKEFVSPANKLLKFHFVHEMTIMMSLVALVLASFLIIQWPYIFANVAFEADLSKYGVSTYSEYVRRGFIELLRVSLFVYGLVWIGLFALRGQRSKEGTILKGVQLVVVAELIIFVISIFRRIWLYQEYHGWSLVRIYGGFFLVWLLIITVILAMRHFMKRNWAIAEVTLSVVFVIALGFFNAEKFIVENHPPTVNKRVDYMYLSRMSADGYIGWKASFEHANEVLNERNYTSKDMLTQDDRREIAYAGRTISNLLDNYEDLVMKYGTKEEKEVYYRNAASHLQTSLEKKLAYYKKEQSIDLPTIRDLESRIMELEVAKNDPNSSQAASIKETIALDTSSDLFYFRSPYPLSFYYWLHPQFNSDIRKEKELSNFDRFLMSNAAEKKAYRAFKEEITHEQLIELANTYNNLYDKVYKQPVQERHYEEDVSLDTPLLERF